MSFLSIVKTTSSAVKSELCKNDDFLRKSTLEDSFVYLCRMNKVYLNTEIVLGLKYTTLLLCKTT